MAASRPGNPDRGWNDPPMFLYKTETQAQQTPKRTALTQRVGMPQNYPSLAQNSAESPGKTKTLLPTSGPAARGPPPSGPPPTGPLLSGPPPATVPSPSIPKGSTAPATSQSKAASQGDVEELPVDLCETTLAKLNDVLHSCQEKLQAQKRIKDDITKKLGILQDHWSSDKLSKPVKQRMGKLAQKLSNRDFDEANEIHLSLMVDYVTEVSQWMVGIKRLIFEAKKHLPPKENNDSSENKQSEEETKLSVTKEEESVKEATDSKSEAGDKSNISKSGSAEEARAGETGVSQSEDDGNSNVDNETVKEASDSKEDTQTGAEDNSTECGASEQ